MQLQASALQSLITVGASIVNPMHGKHYKSPAKFNTSSQFLLTSIINLHSGSKQVAKFTKYNCRQLVNNLVYRVLRFATQILIPVA